MTLAELKQLQALLEQTSQYADQQALYTPQSFMWAFLGNACGETLWGLHNVIQAIEEAMNECN